MKSLWFLTVACLASCSCRQRTHEPIQAHALVDAELSASARPLADAHPSSAPALSAEAVALAEADPEPEVSGAAASFMPDEAVRNALGGGPPDTEWHAIEGSRPGTQVVLSYRLDRDCQKAKTPIDCMDVRVAEVDARSRAIRVLAKSAAIWNAEATEGMRPCSQGSLMPGAKVWLESSRVPVGPRKTAIAVRLECTVECRTADATCSYLRDTLSDAGNARLSMRDVARVWLLRDGNQLRSIYHDIDFSELKGPHEREVDRATITFSTEVDPSGFFGFAKEVARQRTPPNEHPPRLEPEMFYFSCDWNRKTRRYVCLRPGNE